VAWIAKNSKAAQSHLFTEGISLMSGLITFFYSAISDNLEKFSVKFEKCKITDSHPISTRKRLKTIFKKSYCPESAVLHFINSTSATTNKCSIDVLSSDSYFQRLNVV